MAQPSKGFSIAELAERIGARVVGDATATITGVAPLESAGSGDVTFLANPRYQKQLTDSAASAVIIGAEQEGLSLTQLVVDNPYFGYARLMDAFYRTPRKVRGISPDARIDPAARVGEAADIAAFATIGANSVVGDRVTLHPGVHIGEGCTVGDDVTLHANVVVGDHCRLGNRVTLQAGSVVGSDGFGYATDAGVHHKIVHAGAVVLEDDVEMGACVTVDRGVMGDTVIGAGSKVDNLVQVAHNVQVGRGCLLTAQLGISGSAVLGDYVVTGGQVGIAGHVTLGDRLVVAAKSGVTKDMDGDQMVSGFPAAPHREQLKMQAEQNRLPDIRERLDKLERVVRGCLSDGDAPCKS
ncbi:MAG: UDP-3-O-(3-hydroxymyristoyl)glucosamine N-acyltransferase [Leptospirillia bacterium]